MIVYILKHC